MDLRFVYMFILLEFSTLNNKQIEIMTEFCLNHISGNRKLVKLEMMESNYSRLMAFGYSERIRDADTMLKMYQELSQDVNHVEILHLLLSGEKVTSTSKTTAIIANYKKRINILSDFAKLLTDALQ